MNIYPRADYRSLDRYLPDRSPIAADLSDNRNLWGAHPAALEVLAGSDTAAASEYPGSYSDRLVGAVAARLNIAPENVTTGAGGTGVLDALMRAVAPTTMRYLDPGWPAAGMLAVMNGHHPVAVEWREGLDDPVRFAGTEPCIVFLANPGNPTGEAVPDEWIRAVYEHTEAVGSVLIIDEAYGEYNRDPSDMTPCELAVAGERTICVKTLSKAYGLAGLRAGVRRGERADDARGRQGAGTLRRHQRDERRGRGRHLEHIVLAGGHHRRNAGQSRPGARQPASPRLQGAPLGGQLHLHPPP